MQGKVRIFDFLGILFISTETQECKKHRYLTTRNEQGICKGQHQEEIKRGCRE